MEKGSREKGVCCNERVQHMGMSLQHILQERKAPYDEKERAGRQLANLMFLTLVIFHNLGRSCPVSFHFTTCAPSSTQTRVLWNVSIVATPFFLFYFLFIFILTGLATEPPMHKESIAQPAGLE